MKMMPASWQSDCTATATPDDEPPVIMMTPSFSIICFADARAASDFVCVSPVTNSTFLPRMPFPLSAFGVMVFSMPPSPSPFRCCDGELIGLQLVLALVGVGAGLRHVEPERDART